ncbi:23S rRNA (adenine(2503)-C(2))-methyltransferase RlmN [Natranaerobius trueperi]|uniref:Probable dual-specificity RNA methyltransferase RlmN n=1 Tax=Natranaerobius trueperi TaxID=759412 RepID=A0A226BYQ0_9FIRM|nr:23S rRNA (adenine(2503)-C(2))-methyltransferase RlmN [Natranaerobius trueperi]OWZ84168.1 23S rRNA (adenine(2503)-C(2))-methyltransferase RlmN [Natranaerobius trueperi]
MRNVFLKDYTINELKTIISDLGEPKFRGAQIFEWMYQKKVESFENMTNLPKELRLKLKEKTILNTLTVDYENKLESRHDGTIKFLSRLNDGVGIETAIMKYQYGNTVCISSQAGCNMNCAFCASGVNGKDRDLTPGEMIDQFIVAEKLLSKDETISNIVVMGSGEPLENLENLIQFIKIVNHDKGLNIGQRNITVSTCGLVPEIKKLANEKYQVNLAISLHAATNSLRDKLVPINKKYSIESLMEACNYYFNKTKRRITIEFILLRDVNESKHQAEQLADLLNSQDMLVHINLIPFNTVKESQFKAPKYDRIIKFKNILKNKGINTTIRQERGSDIEGACGQLRSDKR